MKTIRTIGILLLVMSFFTGCEFEIYSENTMEANRVMGKIVYSDGSVSEYYDSTKTAVGIVIAGKDDAVKKIVSLTETFSLWWEAKSWCNNYSDASGNSNWYLPSIEELNQLYAVKNTVNTAIDKIIAGGGTATKLGTDYYWSSSGINYDLACGLSFSDGRQVSSYKGEDRSVRAVRAF